MEPNGQKKERYIFAKKEEQVRRANRFALIAYMFFYVIVLVTVWTAFFLGTRKLGFCLIVTLLAAGTNIVNIILYRRNGTGMLMRYIALCGLLAVTFYVGVAFEEYYVRFMAAIPLIGCVLFFDTRFTWISGGLVTTVNVLINIIDVGRNRYEGQVLLEQICCTLSIFLLMLIIYFTTRVARIYNYDTRHSLMEEQEHQKTVIKHVLDVAEQVRLGTESAMGQIRELNESTEVVNGSMQDISGSTQSTAQSIQTQTEMTQNIQQSIQQTLQYADHMLQVAKESEQMNLDSTDKMEDLKRQSTAINKTNGNVVTAMQELQERTNAVKTIADTIYAISNQTNLLALNASIESARAGEAGRGFAVVADEIRQLAEKTRTETENISNISNELSEHAQNATQAVGQSIEAVKSQDEMFTQVSHSFVGMSQNMGQLLGSIEDIDQMLNELSESNNQIVEDITHLSATTQEVTACSAQASELSIKNMQNVTATTKMLHQVLEVSQELNQYMQ